MVLLVFSFRAFPRLLFLHDLRYPLLPFLLLFWFCTSLSVRSMGAFHRFLSIQHTIFSPLSRREKRVRVWIIKTVMNSEYGFLLSFLCLETYLKGFVSSCRV